MSSNRLIHLLAIDTGQIHHGVALVRFDPTQNVATPLYLGTLYLEEKPLKEMVEPRAQMRRIRRTYHERKRRLKRLQDVLTGHGGPLHDDTGTARVVLAYCKRRGHFWGDDENKSEDDQPSSASFPNAEFLQQLRTFLESLITDSDRAQQAHLIACSILGRRSRRPMRINARRVGVCAWEDCRNRVGRQGVGSLVLGIQGKLEPFRAIISRELITGVCEHAVKGRLTPSEAIGRFDQAIVDAVGAAVAKSPSSGGRRTSAKQILADWLTNSTNPTVSDLKVVQRWLGKAKRESIRDMVEREFQEARKRDSSGRAARSRWCSVHQEEFIQRFRAGERWPEKSESADVSRRVSIVGDKMLAYLKRRVLPLLHGQKVDRLVIESTGFDAVKILRKKRRTYGTASARSSDRVNESATYDLYWYGPKADYDGDTKKMLREEFGGLCAYCGRSIEKDLEEDHMFAGSRFPMDGYLARVPCHIRCNREKGKHSLFRRRLSIAPEALVAFERSVEDRKQRARTRNGAIHPIIEVKKGLLQNLTAERMDERVKRCDGDMERAEHSLLDMAGVWMVQTTAVSRYAAHLRRLLAEEFGLNLQDAAQVRRVSGRHTAILRDAVANGFEKAVAKRQGDKVDNHALDAYVLALGAAAEGFPKLAIAERFGRDANVAIQGAADAVDPDFRKEGRFTLSDVEPLAGLEAKTTLGVVGGRVRKSRGAKEKTTEHPGVALSAVAPPTVKKSSFDQNLYSYRPRTNGGGPVLAIRKSVQGFWDDLSSDSEKGGDLIRRICHPRLRQRLSEAFARGGRDAVGTALVAWYRNTARGYDKPGPNAAHVVHPTIQARWHAIQDFLGKADGKPTDIPKDFSIRLMQEGRGDVTPLRRGSHTYYRAASSGVLFKVVGYRKTPTGSVAREKPIVLSIRADWSLDREPERKSYRDVPVLPAELIQPLAHDKTPLRPRVFKKRRAISEWLRIHALCGEIHWVRAGYTLIRDDGTAYFYHNHRSGDWPSGVFERITNVCVGPTLVGTSTD